MRRKTIFVTVGMILAASLMGCSADTTDIDSSTGAEISDTENTETADAETSETSETGNETSETEEEETKYKLNAQDVADMLSIKILACDVVDFEDGGLTGEPADYPNANTTGKATVITLMVLEEVDFPNYQSNALSYYDFDITLTDADGNGLGDYNWYADYIKDDSMRHSWDLDDAINGRKATLYVYSVAGKYDADDIYTDISVSKFSYLTDEPDEAETTRKPDTSSIGDFSAVPNILDVNGRIYKLTANGTGGGVGDIGVEEGKEKITSSKTYYFLPLEGDVVSDLTLEDFHLVYADGFDADYAAEHGYSYSLTLDSSGYNLKTEIAITVDEDLDLSSDEYTAMYEDFVEYVNTYLIGFGSYDEDGNETVFEIEW